MEVINTLAIRYVNNTFEGYRIKASCIEYEKVNNYNIYTIKLHPGCKLRQLEALSAEIQLAMRFEAKPIFMTAPNDGTVKMIAAEKGEKIPLLDIIEQTNLSGMEVVLGMDAYGEPLIVDFAKLPHLLVAGATGSGKSTFLHVLIANFFLVPRNVILYLFDPKLVEFDQYKKFDKLSPTVKVRNKKNEITTMLEFIQHLVDSRYNLFVKNNCRSIDEYIELTKIKMPRLVIVIDELAELLIEDKKDKHFEAVICELAAKARAAGVHMILATQRPSVDVITGLIKANFPVRACFKVGTGVDSRVVIDKTGAENLISNGDGILFGYNGKNTRFQSAYIDPNTLSILMETNGLHDRSSEKSNT